MEAMGSAMNDHYDIRREIERLKLEKRKIEERIGELEARVLLSHHDDDDDSHNKTSHNQNGLLTPDMVYRYSRHLILPSIGPRGQINLLKSSVLVVGAGGLGSPAALYLASCGVGCIGIVDHDVVELNNLHRQIIHSEEYIGKPKVKSAAAACRAINSTVKVLEHEVALKPDNALDIVKKYDVVIDATDNVATRYLISDCCVLLGKPLVSGAALGLEGQLTVYNHKGGPCYRCLFPIPPPTAACQNCSDNGVLGVVPGVIGTLQAHEALKIASAVGEPLSRRMLLFDSLASRVHTVKIRGKSSNCVACGDNPELTLQNFQEFDYEKFTQSPMSDKARPKLKLLPDSARITNRQYKECVDNGQAHVLVDVRPSHHYSITSLPGSLNIPLAQLQSKLETVQTALQKHSRDSDTTTTTASLYVICRRGNDSQRAVKLLQSEGFADAKDIIGGLEGWAHEIDPRFPMY